ncbi:hypothetical protein BDW59DRAFT_59189 [Aspergillus cavernicola]|uniref:Uncharacterized protein n=1 Tax=Aspergillus cavernicola TaxID=176166 RepID=A0ABR4IGV3_9EURO
MFPRGRPCLKRCGLSTVLADRVAAGSGPIPDEPLLFLYPRSFTSRSRQPRGFFTTTSRNNTSTPCRLLTRPTTPRPKPRKQSFGASSRKRWMSTSSSPMLAQADVLSPQEGTSATTGTDTVPTSTAEDEKTSLGDETGFFESFPGLESKGDDKSIPSPALDAHRKTVTNRDGSRGRRPRPLVRLTREQYRKVARRVHHSTGMRPGRVHPLGRMVPVSRVSLSQGLMKLLEDAERRAEFGEIEKQASVASQDPQREVLVPDETIAVFAGVSERFSADENIWNMRLMNGCRVRVLPAIESVGQNRKVILSGTPWATELVEKRIKQTRELQERGDPLVPFRKPPVPVFPSLRALERTGTPRPLLRGVWDFKSTWRPPVALDLIGDHWRRCTTVRGFVEYVEALTTSLPSLQLRGPPHPQKVADALWRLFKNEGKRHLISTAAVNIAMSYLVEYRFFSFATRIFYLVAQVTTVDTYNILLKAAAADQHLHFFAHILRVMSRMRVRPNAITWVAYLECQIAPAAKMKLIKMLKEKGYLQDPLVMRKVLHVMVQELFGEHLNNGGSVDDFFNKTVKTPGLNWFPASLTSQMFRVIARRKNVPAAERLLEICAEHKLPLGSATMSEIIRLYPNDTFSALHHILPYFDNRKSAVTKSVYERLFLNAFRNRHYNICRVVWRYACMTKSVTWPMRKEISFFLSQNIGIEGGSAQVNHWRTTAAKVIAGVDFHLPDYPLRDQLLEFVPLEFHDSPILSLDVGYVEDGDDRAMQRSLARAICKHDMEIGSWYRAYFPLANMLEAAAEMDIEWGDDLRPTTWLLNNAIRVPVELVGHTEEF